MTVDKQAKAAARVLADATGIPYVVARRVTSHPHDGKMLLLAPHLFQICDDLVGESIESLGGPELAELYDVNQAAVSELRLDIHTIDVQVIETFDGGTKVCTAYGEAELTVEGIMSKGDATMAEAVGLVKVIDFDYNRHYSFVVVIASQRIQLEFNAVVTEDAESVDDVSFMGAAPLP